MPHPWPHCEGQKNKKRGEPSLLTGCPTHTTTCLPEA
jgi:hypothetical protein